MCGDAFVHAASTYRRRRSLTSRQVSTSRVRRSRSARASLRRCPCDKSLMKRIVVLYNMDYDAAPDASSVVDAAKAIRDALRENGYTADTRGLRGKAVREVLP